MTEILFLGNGIISMEAISNDEDLLPTGHISINPPPKDGRCYVCGKNINELKPFGGPRDPLVGDFTGNLLVKTFRPICPYDEEAYRAMKEYEKECVIKSKQPIGEGLSLVEHEEREDALEWFVKKFGKGKGEQLFWTAHGCGSGGSSWECRDCIVLDDDEYFERLRQRSKENEND